MLLSRVTGACSAIRLEPWKGNRSQDFRILKEHVLRISRSTVGKAEIPDHSKVHHVILSRVVGMCSEHLNRDSCWDACDAPEMYTETAL